MEPIYSPHNTNVAWQLNWSVSLFGLTALPNSKLWSGDLQLATENDGVRILETHLPSSNVVQFLVSTKPDFSPSQIVRSLKGRLQYLIRDSQPKAFRRNYSILSVGESSSTILDNYIDRQPIRHPMIDPDVQARIDSLQFHSPNIDLGEPRVGNYGKFLNSIQIVIENEEGWHEIRPEALANYRRMILGVGRKKSWLISRIAILSNHIHLLVGLGVQDDPMSAALSVMNNLAYAQGMKPVFRFSYYVGTFGNYDRGAIRQNLSS